MDFFDYRGDALYAEDVPVADLSAEFGTPLYIYSKATLLRHLHAYTDALTGHPHLVCFGMKANSNLSVLQLLAEAGAGFDIVSVGELERVLRAGGDPAKVVFSGVGKTPAEMQRALEVGIHCFNVESIAELNLLQQVADGLGVIAPVSLRINPDVDAKTHPYISTGLKGNKFGIPHQDALAAYQIARDASALNPVGIDCHIGSQLTDTAPLLQALDRLLGLIDELNADGIHLTHLDLGGGLGVTYKDEEPPHPATYMAEILARLKGRTLTLLLEPGRSIAANAGIFVTDVILTKHNSGHDFVIVDGAMNDLIRPSLYGAWQAIIPVDRSTDPERVSATYDVVGPVCESGDFLGKARSLSVKPGDLLAVRSAGAYGFVMASNYNSRPRAAEVLVDGASVRLIRERETLDSLWERELGGLR
ncbi:MAG: diaminopimelate decarboxylase [Litorivicinaceae bacterium]|jgi:diaminopimelate decarboxylase|nr:diaminopimelate decarboxylase [Litorivicinaceae bacterium]MDP5330350.1 diaminopimelate decarboxylase [Litorivicinaceae bacterium]MDP5343523.1 diaminopimelate decarboxylase [Litorivicinaceae bacterium]MDP5363443.1 diaminopimelate decarboxylase [Litorivicinaceae bacterium]